MRRLIYGFAVSLDGYIEGRDGDIGWSEPDEQLHRLYNEQARQADTWLYGRGMYEFMAAYWPTADEDPSATPAMLEYARIWRDTPKIVCSRTLEKVEHNSRLVRDNLADEILALKRLPGKDIEVSGAGLAGSLMRLGLIDEYRLYVFPVVLGGGKRYFPELEQRIDLRLVEARTCGSRVTHLRYQPVSRPGLSSRDATMST